MNSEVLYDPCMWAAFLFPMPKRPRLHEIQCRGGSGGPNHLSTVEPHFRPPRRLSGGPFESCYVEVHQAWPQFHSAPNQFLKGQVVTSSYTAFSLGDHPVIWCRRRWVIGCWVPASPPWNVMPQATAAVFALQSCWPKCELWTSRRDFFCIILPSIALYSFSLFWFVFFSMFLRLQG